MTAIAWVLALGIFAVLFAKYPKFRIGIGVLLSATIAVGGAIYLYLDYQEDVSKSLISADELAMNDMVLSHSYGSYYLSGEIKNNSTHDLNSLVLKVTVYDCPENEITPACEIIGQDDHVYGSVNIPTGQVRKVDRALVSLYNMPRIEGQLLWTYEIVETSAEN